MTYHASQHYAADAHKWPVSWHYLKVTASFALLGAVAVGLVTGAWHGMSFDPRIIGAVVGALASIVLQAKYAL